MTHSERIFSKPIDKLTYSDIETYFTQPRIETDLIEFKEYNPNSNIKKSFEGIHRAFCAMLNSQGGLIVWGAPFDAKIPNQTGAIFQGVLQPIDSVPGKDNMVDILLGKIIPTPNNFNLEVIAHPSENKSVIIIQLEKSEYAPHQFDNKYFMRIDGQTNPAPHHYVEALFKQIKYPNLAGFIKFAPIRDTQHHGSIIDIEVSIWNMSPLQNEHNPKFYLSVEPGQLNEQTDSNGTEKINKAKTGYVSTGFTPQLHYGYPVMKRFSVFYPDDFFKNSSRYISFRLSFGGDLAPMKISTYEFQFSELKHFINPKSAIIFKSENKLAVDIDPNLMEAAKKYLEKPLDLSEDISRV